jgi:inner membrane transporter RhtA
VTRLASSPLGSTLLALGAVLVAMASFQSSASIAESLFPRIGPSGAAGLRLLTAAIMLAAAFRPWRKLPSWQGWRPILIYGASVGVMNHLFYNALARVPLGLAVALEFSGPLAVAMAGSRRPVDFLWIALAVVGLALILRPDQAASGPLDPIGVGFALAAGACWAIYIVFGQRAGDEHGMQGAAMGMIIAAVVGAPYGLIVAGPAAFSPPVLAVGVVVGFLGSAFPYCLEMVALTRLPARTFGTLMSLEPAAGAVAGFFLLHQVLSLGQWVAIGAVVAASAGATATIRPKNPVISTEL